MNPELPSLYNESGVGDTGDVTQMSLQGWTDAEMISSAVEKRPAGSPQQSAVCRDPLRRRTAPSQVTAPSSGNCHHPKHLPSELFQGSASTSMETA